MKKGIWMMIAWLGTVGGSAWANDPTSWHQGELVLASGTEWKGELAYNWKAEVVQCRQGAVIKAYSANQVRMFMYFDDQHNTIRRFLAVECPATSARRRMRLLEEVITGPLEVYREPRSAPDLIRATRLSGYNTDEEKEKDIDNFTYLVVANDELIPLDQFYRTVWPHMQMAFDQEIKKYASLIRANMTGTVGRLRLIYRYNYLVEQLLSQTLPEQNAVFFQSVTYYTILAQTPKSPEGNFAYSQTKSPSGDLGVRAERNSPALYEFWPYSYRFSNSLLGPWERSICQQAKQIDLLNS